MIEEIQEEKTLPRESNQPEEKLKLRDKIKIDQNASISSFSANTSKSVLSIGDEEGNLFLMKPENSSGQTSDASHYPKTLPKVKIEKGTCVIDHVWINNYQIAFTSGKDVKVFDLNKQKISAEFIGHKKVSEL